MTEKNRIPRWRIEVSRIVLAMAGGRRQRFLCATAIVLLVLCHRATSTTIPHGPAADLAPANARSLSALYERTRVKGRGVQPTGVTGSPTAPLFFEAPQFPVGNIVQAVVSGDFNGDGKADLAIADYCVDPTSEDTCRQFGSSVNVLLGNGDGSFQALTRYATGTGSINLVVGDFNHDGSPDLAATNICSDPSCAASSVSILLGKGNGTFRPHTDYLTGPGPFGIAVGDLNGDGKEDLVTSDVFDAITVLLGNGDGSFRVNPDISMSCEPGADFCFAEAVVIGDFNGDLKPDLVTVNYYGFDFSIFLGNGDGTFQPQQDFLPIVGNSSTLAAADLDGDGKLDLVTNTISCNVADSVVIIYGNGDGTFNPAGHVYFSGVNCGPTQVLLADFNGDNKPDIASVNVLGNAVSVFPGVGDGTFPIHEAWGTGDIPVSIAVGDFNGDGKNDLVAANIVDGTISVLLGNGDNTFQSRIDSDTFDDPTVIAAADFNQDGKMDLLTANGIYPTMSLLLGNGNGTFQPHVDFNTSGPFVVSDFNLDGKPDFAVLDGPVSVFLGMGDGRFNPPVGYAVPSSAVSLATADLNGDGKPDVIASFRGSPPDEGLRIYLGNGNGTFGNPLDFLLQSPGSLIAGDFNNDGRQDMLVCGDSGLTVLLGKGDGGFQAPVSGPSGVCPTFVADLNEDGKQDLLAPSANGVVVLLGNGDGSFQSPVETNLGGPATPNSVGDFDADGKIDVAVNQNGNVVILSGRGDGTLQLQGAYMVSGGGMATVADFNADGKPDVASTNASAFTVSVLLNIADIPMFTLFANFAGTGGGIVTFNPGGFACTSNCSRDYAKRAAVSLSAVANTGSTFSGWSGGGCSGTGTCNLTLTSDQTVTATFDLTPDFSVSVSDFTPNPISPGQSSAATISAEGANGFSDTVSLTCSVQPSPAHAPQCSVSPSSITPGNSATATITTTAPTGAQTASSGSASPFFNALWVPMAGVVLAGISFSSRRKRNARLWILVLGFVLVASVIFQAACGGGSSPGGGGGGGTPPGTYTITLTGTSASGSLHHSTTVMLKVQ